MSPLAHFREALQAEAALALLTLPEPPKLDVAKELDLPAPQPGMQTVASESEADVIFVGGQAGPGKSWWLFRECMRHHQVAGWKALVLRRKGSQALESGGVWDATSEMYRAYGAVSVQSPKMRHTFPSGSTVTAGGCQHDANRFDFDSSEYGFIGFDQVEQFTETMFWYIAMSRTRAMTGIRSRVGATANPVTEKDKVGGWLCKLLMDGGWVSRDTGYALDDMSGVVRWLYRKDSGPGFDFFDSKEGAVKARPAMASRGAQPISVTFIPGKLEENPALEAADPKYRSRLEALPWIERQRLLGGNWKVSAEGGGICRREWFRRLPRDPGSVSYGQPIDEKFYRKSVRAWDLAGTDASEDHAKDRTASVKSGRAKKSGRFVIRDCFAVQLGPRAVLDLIVRTALLLDGPRVVVRIPQDPGQAGKSQVLHITTAIREAFAEDGRRPPKIVAKVVRGSKLKRGEPFYTDAEPARTSADGEVELYGNIDAVECPQLDDCLDELHHMDGSDGCADDFWDACADAHSQLIEECKRRGAGVY